MPQLDPSKFHPRRLEAPAWAVHGFSFSPEIEEPAQRQLLQQLPAIYALVDRTLHWAFVEPQDNMWLIENRKYMLDNTGEYYAGRHFFQRNLAQEGQYFVEVECCLRGQGVREIWHPRFVITLHWNVKTQAGTPALCRETQRECELSRLTYRLVKTLHVSDVRDLDITEATRTFLERRWPEVLDCLQAAATEAVEDGSGSGELDDSFFPNRSDMTGAYYIDSISDLEDGGFLVMLHFEAQQYYEGQTDFNYMGYDLSIQMTDGPLEYELWGHSVI